MGLAINQIYKAVEGEGVHIGTPIIFVRLQGCAIGCVNCDSKDTWQFSAQKYSTQEILAEVKKYQPCQKVSITGGDPLDPIHKEGLLKLLHALKDHGYWLNLEASGQRFDEDIFSLVDFISWDIKTPSTQVAQPMKELELFYAHKSSSQIKAVIASLSDFKYVLTIKKEIEKKTAIQKTWVLTPCIETGERFPFALVKEIYEWVAHYPEDFRVICQQHKMVYGSSEINV